MLIERRILSCAYLKEVFTGKRHWVSIATIDGPNGKEEAIDEAQGVSLLPHSRHVPSITTTAAQHPPARHLVAALRWFYLGVSAATLLQQPAGASFLRALLQLLEEYQYHFSSATAQSLKVIRMRGPRAAAASTIGADDNKEIIAPALQRQGGRVLYEHLLTPHLAHGLSGLQVRVARAAGLSSVAPPTCLTCPR